MNNIILDIATTGSIVLGIVAAVSATGYLSKRFKPVFAIAVGLLVSLTLVGVSRENVLLGLISSLSAMGLWSGTKSTVKTDEEMLG